MTIERVHQNALAIVEAAYEYEHAIKKYEAMRLALENASSRSDIRHLSQSLSEHSVKITDLRDYMDSLLDDIHGVVSDE